MRSLLFLQQMRERHGDVFAIRLAGGRPFLQMRPAVPMSARLAEWPDRLGGHSISPGTAIAASALLIHHRPDIYPEPEGIRGQGNMIVPARGVVPARGGRVVLEPRPSRVGPPAREVSSR